MKLEIISCNNCGAPLNVPPSANFVTCAHCGSRLAVKRDATAHYTEVLESIDRHTQEMAEDIEYIRLQNQLDLLDREWQREQRRFMVKKRDGSVVEPTTGYVAVRVGIAIVAMAVTVFWFAVTASAGDAATFYGWLGLVLVAVSLIGVGDAVVKAMRYREAMQDYERQREEVLRRLNESA